MKQELLTQLERLGGTIDQVKGKSLQEDLQAITFKNPLYPNDYDDEYYGTDEFYEKNKQLYKDNKEAFYSTLGDHFFSDHEIPYGQSFFRNFLFTPFRETSSDFGELEGLVEENDVREVVVGEVMDFICICYSYGFPDHYFVCLADPNPENPTVYSTDHEVFFQEIENEGSLEDFFKRFLTKEAFLKKVENYIENIKIDK